MEVVDPVEVHGHVELLVRHLFERIVVGVRAVEKVDGDQRVRRLGVEGIQFLEEIFILREIFCFECFIVPRGKFRSIQVVLPRQGGAAARAALPIPVSVCSIFVCPYNGMAVSV